MGRQPFRQAKADGTRHEAGASSGSASFLENAELVDITGFYANSLFPYGSVDSKYANPFTSYVQYFPFIAPNTGTISKMGTRLSSGFGGINYTVYLGIYSDNDGSPSSLLGKVNLTITGNNYFNSTSFSSSISLTKGTQYWVGYLSSTLSGVGNYHGTDTESTYICYSGQSGGNQAHRKNVRSNNNATDLPSTATGISGYWAAMWPQVYIEM